MHHLWAKQNKNWLFDLPTNMEPQRGGLEDDLPFQAGWFLGSM